MEGGIPGAGGGFRNSEGKILFCFVLGFILGAAERGEQQSELIVARSGKSSLALATHGYQMCRRRGGRRGGRGMWRMGYILKPNNLSFVFRSIVLGRGRMGRGRNPGCFLMQPVPIS